MKRQSVLVLAMIVSVVVIGIWECISAVIFGSLSIGFANWRLHRMKRHNKSAYMGNPSL
jgi:hypothetical protein